MTPNNLFKGAVAAHRSRPVIVTGFPFPDTAFVRELTVKDGRFAVTDREHACLLDELGTVCLSPDTLTLLGFTDVPGCRKAEFCDGGKEDVPARVLTLRDERVRAVYPSLNDRQSCHVLVLDAADGSFKASAVISDILSLQKLVSLSDDTPLIPLP